MCESCSSSNVDRREFLAAGGMLGMAGMLSMRATGGLAAEEPILSPRMKQPARVMVAFLYPPADVVNEGRLEDSWQKHQWFTWPGNQFQPEAQEKTFTEKIRDIATAVGIDAEFAPRAIYTEAQVNEFIERAKAAAPDAVLIVNFWNTFAQWSHRMATESAPTAIVYQPVGSNHQLPRDFLRNTEGLYFIHSIENWDEIERSLRAVHAMKMLGQSRLLRVSGRLTERVENTEERLGVHVVGVPAEEFNALFDAVKADDALTAAAMAFKQQAMQVTDVTDEYFVDAFRTHRAVNQIMERYGADAITIECLFLKHRKPCVSFAMNNGNLIPCGCENDLNATLTLMLGRWLLERGGFQHNPEFDTSENHYFGAHCTCAWKLHGLEGPDQKFAVRPFFHQLPKTAALDVQWTPGEPVLLTKYHSGKDTLSCWTGRVVTSPASPPTGGCATRVLVTMDGVADACDVYPGPHPVFFTGDRNLGRRMKAFARLRRLTLEGNL